jgi:hypothetical protein
MMIKKIIAVSLLLIISIQILPFRQIAAWMFTNPQTEELGYHCVPEISKTDPSQEPFLTSSADEFVTRRISSTSALCGFRKERLFLRHADDILTPPPNGFCNLSGIPG